MRNTLAETISQYRPISFMSIGIYVFNIGQYRTEMFGDDLQ